MYKKITLLIACFLTIFFTTQAQAQNTTTVLNENFDGGVPPVGWQVFIGTNGGGNDNLNNWKKFPGSINYAYVPYNYTDPNDANEDWLVTKKIDVPSKSATLSFDEMKEYASDYSGIYSVRVSTSSQTQHSTFTDLISYGEAEVGAVEFIKREVDLAPYKGQSIYIAFVRTNDNGNAWMIDNVKVEGVDAPSIVCNFSAEPTTICVGESVNFSDLSTNNPTSWAWEFGDEGTSTEQNPSHTYTAPGTYTVTLIASNETSNGTKVMSNYITVEEEISAGENGTLSICAGSEPTAEQLFEALEGNPAEGGAWTHEGMIYTYAINNSSPCGNSTATVTITEIPAPNAGENGTLNICEGTTPTNEQLFEALEGTPDEDGTWTNEGMIYTYTVEATSPCTEPATATVTVTEIPAPNAGTNGTLSVCEGINPTNEQLFNALGGTPNEGGTWSNDGLNYTYTVAATSPCTEDATATVTVTEIPAPNAGTSGFLTICESETVTNELLFEVLGENADEGGTWTNEGLVYTYTVAATSPCTEDATATVTVKKTSAPNAGTSGTLSICEGTNPTDEQLFEVLGENADAGGTWSHEGLVYTYTIDLECGTSSATVTVTEIPAPNAGENGTLSVCEGTTPTNEQLFEALGGNPAEGGEWSNEGMVYTYTVKATSPCTEDATATVTVTEIPAPNAGENGTLSVCEGTTPTNEQLFEALGGNPAEGGEWSHEGMVYTYTVKATSPCTEDATATVTVTEIPAPNAGVDGTLSICEGTTPTNEQLFEALGENANEGGEWSNEGMVYTYTVKATSPCTEDATAKVTVSEMPLPKSNFTVNDANSPVIEFKNTSTDATSYAWNLGDGTTETTEDVTHTYSTNGDYKVTLQATNECGNSDHSETVMIGTVDVANLNGRNVKLYPNPAKDYVKIELGENFNDVNSVSIIDNSGKTVYFANKINQAILNLSVKNFTPGIYFVKILKDNEVIVLELVVLK